MEALILLGLIGLGYSANDDNNNVKRKIEPYKNIQKKNEEDEFLEGEMIHNFINSTSDVTTYVDSEQCADPDGLIFSDQLDAYVNSNDFLTDDRGIAPQPYFKGTQAPLINLANNDRFLETQGGYTAVNKQPKVETSLFFNPEPQNIYGEQFDGAVAEQNRYITSDIKTNELPFEQQQIVPILEKSLLNREISAISAKARSIDALRTLNNPKVSYEGRVLPGGGISRRGEEGRVFKNLIDTTVETGPERNLISVTAVQAATLRPEEILPNTNRQFLNKPLMGSAAPQNGVGGQSQRPEVFRGMRQQLTNDTKRNMGSHISGNINYDDLGYELNSNERDVTSERTHQSNVGTTVQAEMVGIQDDIKHSIKETTIDNPNKQGYVSTSTNKPETHLLDNVRHSIKETTIDNPNKQGYVSTSTNKPETHLLDNVRPSLKETVDFSWSGPASSNINENVSRESSLTSRTNPTKELLSKGRSFGPQGQKVLNHNVNVDIVKRESDYIQKQSTDVDKVYQRLNPYNKQEFTKNKIYNDDSDILLEQINPDILDPFRNNPYTKPLIAST